LEKDELQQQQQHTNIFYGIILALLQDGDSDVRLVASRMVANLTNLPDDNSSDRSSCTSLYGLEQVHAIVITNNSDNNQLSLMLWTRILDSCKHVPETARAFALDHAPSEENLSSSSDSEKNRLLWNLDTSRKIFEDEDPNPYHESLLANHYAIATLLKCGQTTNKDQQKRLQEEILETCREILLVLQKRIIASSLSFPNFIHEMTRSKTLFPSIHGLILASGTILYLGRGGGLDVQAVAAEMISLIKEDPRRELAMHPCIREALVQLHAVQPLDETSRNGLLSCCFLIPTTT